MEYETRSEYRERRKLIEEGLILEGKKGIELQGFCGELGIKILCRVGS